MQERTAAAQVPHASWQLFPVFLLQRHGAAAVNRNWSRASTSITLAGASPMSPTSLLATQCVEMAFEKEMKLVTVEIRRQAHSVRHLLGNPHILSR